MIKFTKSIQVVAIAGILESAVVMLPNTLNLNFSAQTQSESSQERP